MMSRLRRALLIAPAVVLLAGCAPVVDGSGSAGAPSGGATGDFPSASAPTSAPSGSATGSPVPAPSATSAGPPSLAPAFDTVCPDVEFYEAGLGSACLTDSMKYATSGSGGVTFRVTVESGTNWQCEMSASRYFGSQTQPLPIVTEFRKGLLDGKAYGESPTAKTDSQGSRTIDGRPGYVQASTVTLNPAWAAKEKTKVKVEKLWVVAVMTSSGRVSVWYVTVPDLVQNLWSKVPALIAGIKVL